MKWDRLLGVSLAGEYPLEQILGESESGAWFQTFSEARNSRAVLEVMAEDSSAGEPQLACWRRVRLLSHPHLQSLYDCGRTAHHGESLLYAVFEDPDDSLDAALQQGSLTEAEIREVKDAITGALRHLHNQGLVHGAVDARHIIAVGDYIKLATDTVRGGAPGEAEEDFRALEEALGLHTKAAPPPPAAEPAAEPPAELEPALVSPVEPRAAAAPVIAEPVTAAPVTTSAALPPPLSHPLRDRAAEPDPDQAPADRARAFWPYAAAAVVLVGGIVAITHKPPTESSAAPPVAAPPVVAKPAPPVAAPATPPAVTARRNPAPPPASASVAHRAMEPARGRTEWRVIAYTYSRMKDAENKARSINQKMPGFKAEVYSPKGRNQPPFLVALGGRMTRTDAQGLQRKAISRGLPRDTFIRNYTD